MLKKICATIALSFLLAHVAAAQNTNSSTTTTTTTTRRQTTPRRATPNPSPTPSAPAAGGQDATTTPAPASRTRRAGAAASDTASRQVRAAFDNLIKSIERSDVEAVMALYWNSPQLIIFNNNGTVTRSWEQVRANRASSYPEAKDVRVETRDVRVSMLGADGAAVTCLWTQSQEFRGQPESATGRLTVVYRRINNGWKIVHTHTSPEAPDPSRLLPSEQTAPAATPIKPPARP